MFGPFSICPFRCLERCLSSDRQFLGNDDFIQIGVILNLFQDLLFEFLVVAICAVYCKGVVSFFFFVKILIIRGGYTRMYLSYKNAYKRLFWSFVQG